MRKMTVQDKLILNLLVVSGLPKDKTTEIYGKLLQYNKIDEMIIWFGNCPNKPTIQEIMYQVDKLTKK